MPLDFQPLGESLWSKGLLCISPKEGFPYAPFPTLFPYVGCSDSGEEDISSISSRSGLFYCSSIIERFVGIIFVQTCTFFLVGMHVGILSYSEVTKDKFCLPQGKRVYIFSFISSKSPGQVVSFSLEESFHFFLVRVIRYAFSCGSRVRGQTQRRVSDLDQVQCPLFQTGMPLGRNKDSLGTIQKSMSCFQVVSPVDNSPNGWREIPGLAVLVQQVQTLFPLAFFQSFFGPLEWFRDGPCYLFQGAQISCFPLFQAQGSTFFAQQFKFSIPVIGKSFGRRQRSTSVGGGFFIVIFSPLDLEFPDLISKIRGYTRRGLDSPLPV